MSHVVETCSMFKGSMFNVHCSMFDEHFSKVLVGDLVVHNPFDWTLTKSDAE